MWDTLVYVGTCIRLEAGTSPGQASPYFYFCCSLPVHILHNGGAVAIYLRIMDDYDEKQIGAARHLESLRHAQTHVGTDGIENLTEEHRQYLLQRHGTLELDPLPDASDADPYNWSTSKV